ncbi:MAG: M1 family metallopeptidase [Lewinellaceae bacterium]|nr:M1 family metallopeptidase [Lewinellaceae bacterium]
MPAMRIFFHTLLFTAFALSATLLPAQHSIPRLEQLDVLHYTFQLELSDETDEIKGVASIDIRFLQPQASFTLDLVGKTEGAEKGMAVSSVTETGENLRFEHEGEALAIYLAKPAVAGEQHSFQVRYAGIPADGLIIDKNQHGDRTFFGDNWPNRAHHWLPCIDHPSDKATVDLIVTAPNHYQVVGNGMLVEESYLNDSTTLTHWREEAPLPTKVIVIGAARFAVQRAGEAEGIPVSTWVYYQDREAGFYDYAQAVPVMQFFIDKIGPYSYQKLANVQSKTRYGGMENAGCIFYFEQSVTGQRDHEDLIAHEVAHQWFGNSASEKNWHHIWLSEGFATYGANLYIEHTYGRDKMVERLQSERQRAIAFYRRKPAPIVDTTVEDWNELLNPNSYQKAGFVLHMLRRQVGEEAFWQGLRQYYAQYRNSNALTEDFQRVMEQASGQDLSTFFQQWLYRAGFPRLEGSWKYAGGKLQLSIRQAQKEAPFIFPLDIEAKGPDGKSRRWTVDLKEQELETTLDCPFEPTELVLDPDTWLLFTGKLEPAK